MRVYTPEISWHNRLPTLALDIAPLTTGVQDNNCLKVATGGNDSRVYIWSINPDTLDIKIRAGLRRHQKSVGAVRFSVQHVLASGDDDGYIYLWKQKNEEVQRESETFNSFLNDDGFEDVETWQHLRVLRGHIEDVCDLTWSSEGKYLLSGSVDNSAILWDTTKGTKIWCSDLIKGYVQGVAIDPRAEYMIALSSDRTLRTYGFSDRRLLYATRRMNIKNNQTVYTAFFCDDTVQTFCRRLQFSPDGQYLVVPTSRMIERENQLKKNEQPESQGPSKPVNILLVFKRGCFNKPHLYYQIGKEAALCVRFCPIAYTLKQSEENLWKIPYRYLFAVATTRSLLIYDTQQSTPIGYVSQIHLARLTDVAWSHDGRMLIISSYDGYTSVVVFDNNELGEPSPGPLISNHMEQQQPEQPPEPKKEPEALTIRKFLIKRPGI